MESVKKEKWGLGECMKSCVQLIGKSFSLLMLFEVVYKLAATYVIMPACMWLLSTSMKIWGTSYVSTENLVHAIGNPLLVLSTIIVLFVLTMYTMFEISFLTLSFNQSEGNKPLGFLRMLKIAGQDAVRVLYPKNYLLLLFILVIIPISNSLMVSSLLGGIEIPNYIMEVVVDNPLYMTGFTILSIALVFILFRYLFIFHVYTLEDKTVKESAGEAVKLIKKRKIKSAFIFLVASLIFTLVFTLIWQLLIFGISMLCNLFVGNEYLYTVLLLISSFMNKLLSFAVASFSVLTGYGIITAMFFRYRKEDGLESPGLFNPVESNKQTRKENFRISAIVLAVCFLSVLGITYINVSSGSYGSTGDIRIMAHRGASTNAPENTIPAFQKAIDLNADYIELDVQETKDGVIVVTHDSNFVRCTGHKGNVWQMTYDEISKLDASSYMDTDEFKGTKIPKLSEVMELCKGKIKMNIELKSNGHEKHLEKSVAGLIKEYQMEDQVVITSLTKKCLINLKLEMPDMPCGYIVAMALGDYYDMDCADFFSIEESFISSKTVSEAHKRGKTINAWTIDTIEDSDKMINLGVDSIITNDPVMARESILGSKNPATRLSYILNQ